MHRRVALVAMAWASLARAEPTGESRELCRSADGEVLELLFPKTGAYRRALDEVRATHYRRAADLFLQAASDVEHAADEGQVAPAQALTLARKAEFEAHQAYRVLAAERARNAPPFETQFAAALALHNLYLTARALFGDDPILYQRARVAYRALFSSVPSDRAPVLALAYAGLLADGGEAHAARVALSDVSPAARTAEPLLTAHAWTALGDADRALSFLRMARDTLPDWREAQRFARISNDFDRLRRDPRFRDLVGEGR